MLQITKTLDLRTLPFARAGSRFLIFEKAGANGCLYISIASASASMFGVSGEPHEVLKIETMKNGENIPYSCTADPFCLEIFNEQGYIRFAIEGYYLIIEGKGLTLHISAKKGGAFLCDSIKTTIDGALIPIKGVKMTFTQQKGTQELVAPWSSELRGSANPDLYIYPDENGEFKTTIIDQTCSEEELTICKSVEECAAEAREDFENFCKKLIALPENKSAIAFKLAYAFWAGLQPNGDGLPEYCTNKVSPIYYRCHEQAVAAMAFDDTDSVLNTIALVRPYMLKSGAISGTQISGINHYEPDIPLLGMAAYHAVSLGKLEKVDSAVLQRALDLLTGRAEWWIRNRSDSNGRFWYGFRKESGVSNAPYFGQEERIVTPDLTTYMLLLFTALSELCKASGDTFSSEKWNQLAEKEIDIIKLLWNGERFDALGVSGERYACGESGILPVVAAKLLPDEITDKLCWHIKSEDLIVKCLLTKGIFEAGKIDAARKLAEEILNDCEAKNAARRIKAERIAAGANYSPAVCAAIIALGKVLKT